MFARQTNCRANFFITLTVNFKDAIIGVFHEKCVFAAKTMVIPAACSFTASLPGRSATFPPCREVSITNSYHSGHNISHHSGVRSISNISCSGIHTRPCAKGSLDIRFHRCGFSRPHYFQQPHIWKRGVCKLSPRHSLGRRNGGPSICLFPGWGAGRVPHPT